MASTTALFTGLSGLNVNARRLEVIGNNISNVNTYGFKANRMHFAPAFNRDFSLGTAPGTSSGGSNPGQVGLGVTISGTQRILSNGAISPTGLDTDLAIEGQGFFVVERGSQQFYTRSGAFQFNGRNDLVTVTGERLKGFGVDSDFNIIPGRLTDVNIPLGTMTLAEATRNVNLSGNLRADGDVATTGSTFTFAALLTGGVPATGATLLTAIDGAGIVAGDSIRVTGAKRGNKDVPDADYVVTATSTVNDMLTFMQDALGVVPDGGYVAGDPTGAPEPGAFSISGAGVVTFVGNFGEANDIALASNNLQVVPSGGGSASSPFSITKTAEANGEAVRNTFVVYDSLGTAVNVDVTMVLAFREVTGGSYWRTFLHSADDSDIALHLESGDRAGTFTAGVPLVRFDEFGALRTTPTVAVEIDRAGTGAASLLNFDLNFQSAGSGVTGLGQSGGTSTIAATFQDGSPLGVLSSFSVGSNGIITGGFDNGLTRTLGQIAFAGFTNPEGLVDTGNNLFTTGPNSGTALIAGPEQFGGGRVIGGALELSNVDLSQEFINMILTTTGYSAASRIITTSDQLIQQLLVLGR
ncbi:MAG TPA: flagellar hook-basal body complex protein [Phycisphaerales bacterium]|nr:flagellar hook-basal body complex protein [Phycisphaerales bacterium]